MIISEHLHEQHLKAECMPLVKACAAAGWYTSLQSLLNRAVLLSACEVAGHVGRVSRRGRGQEVYIDKKELRMVGKHMKHWAVSDCLVTLV